MNELATKDGFQPVHTPGELKQVLAAAGNEGPFRVLYTPLQGDERAHFEAVNELVFKRKHLLYAIDEVDKNQEPNFAPPWLYQLINYCRHQQIAMIGCARRPAQVSKEYTFGLREICAFRFTEPGDLKYWESKCGAEAAVLLPKLQQYGYVRWIEGGQVSVGKGWK